MTSACAERRSGRTGPRLYAVIYVYNYTSTRFALYTAGVPLRISHFCLQITRLSLSRTRCSPHDHVWGTPLVITRPQPSASYGAAEGAGDNQGRTSGGVRTRQSSTSPRRSAGSCAHLRYLQSQRWGPLLRPGWGRSVDTRHTRHGTRGPTCPETYPLPGGHIPVYR